MVFCPRLYFAGASATWNDPELFVPFEGGISGAEDAIAHALPQRLQNKYKWGINAKSKLPYGFVFLKRKKNFAKGRTLISYWQSRYGALMQTTAKTIDLMCSQLWEQNFGQLSIPSIWAKVHHHFETTPSSVMFQAINDDLIGFFSSVPQPRLLQAVQSLVHHWQASHGSVDISIDVKTKGPVQHTSFIGSCNKTRHSTRKVAVKDIFPIVQASLKTHVFVALNQVWKQFRGAGIGAHISPALSNLAVTLVEQSWARDFVQSGSS